MKLTIFSPHFDRHDNFPRLMWHLRRQLFRDFEFIFLDDHPTPEAKIWFDKNPMPFPVRYYFTNRRQGVQGVYMNVAPLRNMGFIEARTNRVMTIEPEMLLPNTITLDFYRTFRHLEAENRKAVIESSIVVLEAGPSDEICHKSEKWKDTEYITSNIDKLKLGRYQYGFTTVWGMHKTDWDMIGRFKEDWAGWGGEDGEIARRANDHGIFGIYANPVGALWDAPVHTDHPRPETYKAHGPVPVTHPVYIEYEPKGEWINE